MLRRRGERFRDASGETARVGIDIGLDTILFGLTGLAIGVVIWFPFAGSPAGTSVEIFSTVIAVFAPYLFGATLTGIARTALYVYPTESVQPSEFHDGISLGRRRRGMSVVPQGRW